MAIRQLKENIHAVGAIDWDRRLFDELIPLPYGTSYNAYLVRGSEKTALLDTVDPVKTMELLHNLRQADVARLDYVISHHAEQDHSGSIPAVLEAYPMARVVTNPKCKDLLQDLLHIPAEKFITVEDGATVSLGDKTLKFIYTPLAHWPETMVTYLPEDKVLFSCDFLGSHVAASELFVRDEGLILRSAKTYFAEIMMPFRSTIKKNLAKVQELDLDYIAPSHGPVHHRPDLILRSYAGWVADEVTNMVVLPYVSMHGSTRAMADYLMEELMRQGVQVEPFNLPHADIGDLARGLVDAATVVLASPTVLVGPHPAAVYAAYLANVLRPKTRFASIIGSYGWGSKMVDNLVGMLGNLKVELLEPVVVKGFPREEDYQALGRLAGDIAGRHRSLGLI